MIESLNFMSFLLLRVLVVQNTVTPWNGPDR
jgi:hypothetical protein